MAREFEDVDFERHEDEKLLKEFVKLYSFYISDYMHVYKTTKKAMAKKFSVIKDDIIELARKGSKKALAFYLQYERDREEDLVNMAKQIEEKKDLKSAEEWEVVAYLHFFDKVYVLMNGIETVEDLHNALGYSWVRFDELENEYDHGRYIDVFTSIKYDKKEFEGVVHSDLRRCGWLLKCMKEEKFYDAIRHAQVGYYGRFHENRKFVDMWQYLEIRQNPYDMYISGQDIKKAISSDYLLYSDQLCTILKEEKRRQFFSKIASKFGGQEKKLSVLEKFSFARSYNLIGKEGFLGSGKFDKLIDSDFMKLIYKDEKNDVNDESAEKIY